MFKYNLFLFKDLPSAWLCGVRIIKLNKKECKAKVRHNWFNSNPFKSLYWVVQGMASELTTGMLIINQKEKLGYNISMLVTSNSSKFLKKAKGKIVFECTDIKKIEETQMIERPTDKMSKRKSADVDLKPTALKTIHEGND